MFKMQMLHMSTLEISSMFLTNTQFLIWKLILYLKISDSFLRFFQRFIRTRKKTAMVDPRF